LREKWKSWGRNERVEGEMKEPREKWKSRGRNERVGGEMKESKEWGSNQQVKEVEVWWVKCKMWNGWVTNIGIEKLTREEKGSCREARRSTDANGFVQSSKAEELRRSKGEHHRGWVTGKKHRGPWFRAEHRGGALTRPRNQWRRTTKNEKPRRSLAEAEEREKHHQHRERGAPRRRNESRADAAIKHDGSDEKSYGRKKDGVSKRQNTVKDSIHAHLSLLLFGSSYLMAKSKKRWERETQCDRKEAFRSKWQWRTAQ
jgi:hypothetical protein